MIAQIITVGTEILMGQILNSNAQFISQRLAELGVDMYTQLTVGDNHDRLYRALAGGLEKADILILTGGLGPTSDDISKETAAEVLGKTLVLHQPSLEAMTRRFSAMHRNMTPNNAKQAMFPEDCIVLPNNFGTAPGCIMEREDGKAIALLPGPPRELIPMFNDYLMPYLEERSGHILYSRIMRIFGMGESTVEHTLTDLLQSQTNPTIAPYAKTGEVTLRVTARCANMAEGRGMVEPVLENIREILGDVVYSTEDEPLERVCANLLLAGGNTLAVAESCTGGMLASKFVSVPGCSTWFLEGVVTYSNAAKMSRLGVKKETLEAYGAVSRQVAAEMAEGIVKTSGAQYGLSTTGIAGPDGGSAEKPVGLAYIALSDGTCTDVLEVHTAGDRERVRHITCLNAMDLLRRKLSSINIHCCDE